MFRETSWLVGSRRTTGTQWTDMPEMVQPVGSLYSLRCERVMARVEKKEKMRRSGGGLPIWAPLLDHVSIQS